MATRYRIDIDSLQSKGTLLVCRCVLEGLEGWLKKDSHEKILAAIATLNTDLLSVRNELYEMRDHNELQKFQPGSIRSVRVLIINIEEAYTSAFEASDARDNNNGRRASESIRNCYNAIRKTIGEILISPR